MEIFAQVSHLSIHTLVSESKDDSHKHVSNAVVLCVNSYYFLIVACQSLPGVANGTLSFGTNGVETFINVACGVGSSMSGSNKVQCNSDGSWNSSLPVCSKLLKVINLSCTSWRSIHCFPTNRCLA